MEKMAFLKPSIGDSFQQSCCNQRANLSLVDRHLLTLAFGPGFRASVLAP
jgi:hypothetical protein